MLTLDGLRIELDGFRLDADFTLPGHAVTAMLGPSGAGKSTLLAAIAGFVTPAAGRVLWQGRDLGPLAPGDRPLTMLFQDQNLFPHLTAFQNVALGIDPGLRLDARQSAEVERVLDRTGLGGLGGRKPGALSGGQQSRVALARALLRGRPLLLLDEAFGALGPALKDEMLDLVAGIAGETGAAVLMVSHDPQDAQRIAAQTVLVADGRAHPPQPTAALLADPPPALRRYLGT